MINVNIGVMGHVDSGKTSLLKAIFKFKGGLISTAGLDKHPQSKERGITLDLGFTSIELPLTSVQDKNENTPRAQICFVDCPGHSSLIRAVLGAAQIIDRVLLVIDITKGMQAQSLECLVLAEILCRRIIIVLNKTDLIPEAGRAAKIAEVTTKLSKLLISKTSFRHGDYHICSTAAAPQPPENTTENKAELMLPFGLDEVLRCIDLSIGQELPIRDCSSEPLMFVYDHAFLKKGFGSVLTGTVVAGSVSVGQEVALINGTKRKVRSIQSFKQSISELKEGMRGGVSLQGTECIALERGLMWDSKRPIPCFDELILAICPIRHFKEEVISGCRMHLTAGHKTAIGTFIFFSHVNWTTHERSLHCESATTRQKGGALLQRLTPAQWPSICDLSIKYTYNDRMPKELMEDSVSSYAFVRMQKNIKLQTPIGSLVIGSRLDLDKYSKSRCRISFVGKVLNLKGDLSNLFVGRTKEKRGQVLKIIQDENVIVGGNMFESAEHVRSFVGYSVKIKNTHHIPITGVILRPFGNKGKFVIRMDENVLLTSIEEDSCSEILLRFTVNVLDSKKERLNLTY